MQSYGREMGVELQSKRFLKSLQQHVPMPKQAIV